MTTYSNQVAQLREAYSSKNVVITGGHGFKGYWFALLLHELGANVSIVGIRSDYNYLKINLDGINSYECDVTDPVVPKELITSLDPDYLFHLAAQPLVSLGFEQPEMTFETNVMGTVRVLEAARNVAGPLSIVNVTTDKVYKDQKQSKGYIEDDVLMGIDPYSSSKSCSELVTFSYNESFFKGTEKIVSTCRAGNVLGGGDFAINRIVPDLARGLINNEPVTIRNFNSIRPYQHVLDALFAYALLAANQMKDPNIAGSYNVGPNEESILYTHEIVDYAVDSYPTLNIIDESSKEDFPETEILKLDSSKYRKTFDWSPHWASKEDILYNTFNWYNLLKSGKSDIDISLQQIRNFLND